MKEWRYCRITIFERDEMNMGVGYLQIKTKKTDIFGKKNQVLGRRDNKTGKIMSFKK